MEFIVSVYGSRPTVTTIEASDEASATTVARDRFLPTERDKKYGNFALVPKPTTKEGWIELDRRLCRGNGEFFENFGYLPDGLRRLAQHVGEELKRAEEPEESPTG
jgi:hypothetical protein